MLHSRAIGFCFRVAGLRNGEQLRGSQPPIYMVLTQNVAKMLLFLKEAAAT